MPSPLRRALAAATLALAAAGGALTGTAPAAAAPVPTITAPASRVGWGPVTLTGTAAPGAVVQLYESAYNWNDLQPADDWQHGGGPVTTRADDAGHWRLQRVVDTGFLFAVRADGEQSRTATVLCRVHPVTSVMAHPGRRVTVRAEASPNQPHLPVQAQRRGTDGRWTTLARGWTDEQGRFAVSLTAQPVGVRAYRVWIGGDAANGVLSGYSTEIGVRVR